MHAAVSGRTEVEQSGRASSGRMEPGGLLSARRAHDANDGDASRTVQHKSRVKRLTRNFSHFYNTSRRVTHLSDVDLAGEVTGAVDGAVDGSVPGYR